MTNQQLSLTDTLVQLTRGILEENKVPLPSEMRPLRDRMELYDFVEEVTNAFTKGSREGAINKAKQLCRSNPGFAAILRPHFPDIVSEPQPVDDAPAQDELTPVSEAEALTEEELAQFSPGEAQGVQQSSVTPSPANFPTTDMGNGERFASRYRDRVRWCEQWKKWLIYNGKYWRRDDSKEIGRYAKTVVRAIYREAANAQDYEARIKLAKHAVASESTSRANAMLEQAKSELPITTEELNRQLNLLNCKNGTVDLETGDLYSHDSHEYITRYIDIDYNPEAQCPRWEKFLTTIFNHDLEMVSFIQQALGMSLSGSTQEQKFFICHGNGSNGKTTMLEVVRRILASYAVSANIETFVVRQNEGVRNDLAELYGARFVTASENKLGSRLNEALIKKATGGEAQRARFLFSNEFEYMPEYTLWLAVNHKPIVKDTTKGMWRRVVFIPFTVVFEEEHIDPEKKIDPLLTQALMKEKEGILAWLVRGCMQWVGQGRLTLPQAAKEAIDTYRVEMDVLAGFIQDCCEEGTGLEVQAAALYKAYIRWCDETGEKPETRTSFGLRMGEQGYQKIRKTAGHFYQGIKLPTPLTDDDIPSVDVFPDGKVTFQPSHV